MSDSVTKRMISAYVERAPAMMFLSGFFQTPPENIHDSEKVEIDIERDGEDVAIVIEDLSAGARHNESSVYTNKEFTPPIYDEEGTITGFDLIKRSPGRNPFEDPSYNANAINRAFAIFRKLDSKIRRAIELMASQVLQTGTLTLVDGAGSSLYTLNFSPKATHFVTVGTTWATSTTKLADVEGLADTVWTDGKNEPRRLIFGAGALRNFLGDAAVQAQLDNRRFNLGSINAPETRGAGGKYHGEISIGQFSFEIWSYLGFYKDPQTGNATKYVADDKVIMLGDGRLDLTYGAIPRLIGAEQRAIPFLPNRISDSGAGLDLTTNAWFTPDGRHLKVSAGTRPLTIPTAIDTFGALDTVP